MGRSSQLLKLYSGRTSFSPLSLSPALWLDASDLTTLFQDRTGASASTPVASDSDPVGTWKDKSGNAYHATAASDATRGVSKFAIQNGKSVILTDGVDDKLTVSSSFNAVLNAADSTGTVFLVCRKLAGGSPLGGIFGNRGGGWITRHNSNTKFEYSHIDNTIASGTNSLTITDGWHLYTVSRSGLTVNLGVDGLMQPDLVWNGYTVSGVPYRVGEQNSAHLNAYFAEILVYTPILSDANRLLVHQYLASKWGITLS